MEIFERIKNWLGQKKSSSNLHVERLCFTLDRKRIVSCGGSDGDCVCYLMKCHRCGAFALYDPWLEGICFNPQDLTQQYFWYDTDFKHCAALKCPHCKAKNSYRKITCSDMGNIRKSEWAFFLNEGIRIHFEKVENPDHSAKVWYADCIIQAEIAESPYDRTWRLSADTFTCTVVPKNSRLIGMDAYAPPTCWVSAPELQMSETTEFYQVYFDADFDSNGIAPLCEDSNKKITWEYSQTNGVIRAVFENRTERFYAIAPNLVIGVCDVDILSEVRFGGIEGFFRFGA